MAHSPDTRVYGLVYEPVSRYLLVSVLDDMAYSPDALVRLISGLTVHRHRHFANVVFRHD